MNKVILHRITSANAREEEIVVDLDSVTVASPMNGRTELWIGERSLFVTEGLDHFKATRPEKIANSPVVNPGVPNKPVMPKVEEVKIPVIEAPKLPVKTPEKKAPTSGRTTSSALG